MNLIVISWITITFAWFMMEKFRRDAKLKRAFWDFGEQRWVARVLLLLFACFALINIFFNGPHFGSAHGQVAFGKRTHQPWLESAGYRLLLKSEPYDADNNFGLVQASFDPAQAARPDPEAFAREREFIVQYYSVLSLSDNYTEKDIGNLCLSLHHFLNDEAEEAKKNISNVRNSNLKHYHELLGRINDYYHDAEAAILNYKLEIAVNGAKEDAYRDLARCYYYNYLQKELYELANTSEGKKFVPAQLKERIYFLHSQWKEYFFSLLSGFYEGASPVVLIAALLVLFAWVLFLRRISFFYLSWKNIFLTVLLSMFFVLPVLFVYGSYEYEFHFQENGNSIHDFLYCVFGIGALEELGKVIPFLIILRFTDFVREPIDYIVYASLAALGFSFAENLRYIDHYGPDVIHTRAFTAAISHMIDTSIIAYGMILGKFRYGNKKIFFFFLFFFIAALSHGFYDFWLRENDATQFSIITFFYLLTCVLFYSSFINNALNHSQRAMHARLNTKQLAANLAASLSFIIVFEFICVALRYGTSIANHQLSSALVSGGYMILFLSVRLSNIDIVNGEWAPIEFFTSPVPLSFVYDTKPDHNSVVGKNFIFSEAQKPGRLQHYFPASGEVLKREKISGFSGWFRVRMDKPLLIYGKEHRFIFMRAKDEFELIENNASVEVACYVPETEAVLGLGQVRKKDLFFADRAIVN